MIDSMSAMAGKILVGDHDRDSVARADELPQRLRADRLPHGLAERVGLVGQPRHEPGLDVKAITYHQLSIRKIERGFVVTVYLDI